MNENEFGYEGKTYVAKETNETTCRGCAFAGKRYCPDYYGLPSCGHDVREDRREVIFVEKKMKITKDKTMDIRPANRIRSSLRIMHTLTQFHSENTPKVDDREDFKCAAEYVERAIYVLSKIIDRHEYVSRKNRNQKQ